MEQRVDAITKYGKFSRVLGALADEASLELLRRLALANDEVKGATLKDESMLTRKLYYTRLYRLRQSGLVKKESGKYFLTAFGRITFDTLDSLQHVFDNRLKLAAVDLLLRAKNIPEEEQQEIVDALLADDPKIRDVFVKAVLKKSNSAAEHSSPPPDITTPATASCTSEDNNEE